VKPGPLRPPEVGAPPRGVDRAVVAVLAVLAYVPILLAAPGRMPADSKLYLYLDPGRLLADAAASFDPRQFAGWVPHQHIAYLWPAGPWFWLFEALGVPDWIAHRLWIGSLLLAAGLGVRWCARLLGLSPVAALAAALMYQLSPYLLPYVSRTSVMLLPWAGLGWIVGLTIRATRRADAADRLARWADPAALALVVFTVGAVNATALAMIVPVPVLWLVHTVWLGDLRWRAAVATALRIALLAVGTSLWWAVMLVIQGRHGADVLPYSESLADVSFTATAPEVWRGLGYWLFYIDDRFAPTTTAALPYLASTGAILVSYAVPLIGLVGLAAVRWRHRRFAALLVAAGLVLAVGVHPIGDRSPLMRILTGNGDDGLALALRSSTRALPMAALGLALAAGAAITALQTVSDTICNAPRRRHERRRALQMVSDTVCNVRRDWVAAGLVGLLAVANLPALRTGDLVDPALTRDEDPPAAWQAAADALDTAASRVLQVPGLEFGAFRWGYTVDQPLPGMADSPLVTRDLLPLGSPAAMDLVFALDDRIQDGVLEPGAVAPVARLLGAGDIWLTNDAAFDRFDVTAPGIVGAWLDRAPGIGEPAAYGAPTSNRPAIEIADARYLANDAATAPAPPVEVYPVGGDPQTVRAAGATMVVSGSGDGIVDAAAAALLPDGTALVYSAATEPDELAELLAASSGLLVTDSNRARARHWRSSQDTTGFTESAERDGAAPTTLTEPAVGDARLPVFAAARGTEDGPADADTQTTAEQRGPVVARASAYGQPFALLPEHRPFMAVDGDPGTAWVVGEHGDPVGESFTAVLRDADALPRELTITQYDVEWLQRQISRLTLRSYATDGQLLGAVPVEVVPAADGPTTVPLDLPAGTARIVATIDAVAGGEPFTEGMVAGVGFAEFDLGLGPTVEVVRVPSDALDRLPAGTPLTIVLTRLRTDPSDRWRDDPEPTLVREFELPDARTLQARATVRLDARADDAQLADLLGWPVRSTSRLLGRPEHAGPAAIDGDPATAWITGYDGAAEATLTIDDIGQPVTTLTVHQPVSGFTRATELTLRSGGEQRTVTLVPDATGASHVVVDPPLPAGQLSVAITATEPAVTIDRRFGDQFELPAAITEIELSGLPALPDFADAQALTDCIPLATVDGAPRSAQLTTTGELTGPHWLGSIELVALPCDPAGLGGVTLEAGTHLLQTADTGLPVQLDRVVLVEGPVADGSVPGTLVTERGQYDRTIEVSGCPDGCWVIAGEGYNDAWTASVDGTDLGPPTLVDGGFTGWWVTPDQAGGGTFTLHAHWTARRPLTYAYAISAATVLACLAVLIASRRVTGGARHVPGRISWSRPQAVPAGAWHISGRVAAWVVVGFLLVGPWGALWGLLGALGMSVLRERRVPELTAVACVAVLAVAVALRERNLVPPANGGWPHVFERFHGLGTFAISAIVMAAVFADDADRHLPSAP
jgi:arabinofuranan 3-O-arabinosyltransferase